MSLADAVDVLTTAGRAWASFRRALCGVVLLAGLCDASRALDPQLHFRQYAHEHWSIDEGLPLPGGYVLAQDNEGYIWLGSMAGLARFDGSRIVNFSRHDTPGLAGTLIYGLVADNAGRLWVGTDRGASIYEKGVFTEIPHLQGRNVRVLGLDGELMLVSDLDTVYGLDAEFRIRVRYAIPRAIDVARLGDRLWFSSQDSNLYCACSGEPQAVALAELGRRSPMYFTRTGDRLWLSTDAGLYTNDGGAWQRHTDERLQTRILSLTSDRDGNLWVGTELTLLRLRDGVVVEEADISDIAPAPRFLFEDNDGALWVASHQDGLHRFWNGHAQLTPLLLPRRHGQFVWAIASWQGGFLAGGTFGLARETADGLAVIDGMQEVMVYSLHRDGDSMLVGTVHGAYRVHPDGRVEAPSALQPLQDTRVNTFLRDRSDRLWIGTTRGLYRLDPDRGLHRLTGQDNSNRWEVRTLRQLRDGRILAAGEGGLWQLIDDTVLPLPLPKPGAFLLAIHETADGALLLGSLDDARLYLQHGDDWLALGPERGVPTNEVYTITPDGNGNLLVTGLRGAYTFTERELATLAQDPDARLEVRGILTLNRKYMPGQEVACCLGGGDGRVEYRDGLFHISTTHGMLRLRIPPQTEARAHSRIDRLSTPRRPSIVGKELATPGLQLGADERDLQIEFSAASLAPLHVPQLFYRLHGYDRDWHRLPAQAPRMVQYTNLPAGDYRFEVVNASAAEAAPAVLHFTLAPRPHEMLWFQVMVASAATSLLFVVAHLNQRRLVRRQHELEHQVALRTAELRRANERMDALSRTDPLTGVHNRRHASEDIPARLRRMQHDAEAGRPGKAMLFALLDIDHFKAINDTHGHNAGDRVLQEVARRLSGYKRHDDGLVRWGGEEFLLMLYGIEDGQQAALAERACAVIRDTPIDIDDSSLQVTCSVGIVLVPARPAALAIDWEQIVHLADVALYEAKHGGRNCWREARLPAVAMPEARPT